MFFFLGGGLEGDCHKDFNLFMKSLEFMIVLRRVLKIFPVDFANSSAVLLILDTIGALVWLA